MRRRLIKRLRVSEIEDEKGDWPYNMCGPRKVLKSEKIAVNAFAVVIEGYISRAERVHRRSKTI